MNVLGNSSLFKVMKSAANGCSSVFTLTSRCPLLSPEMDACEYMFLNTAATRFSFHIRSRVHSGHDPLTSGFYLLFVKGVIGAHSRSDDSAESQVYNWK